MDIDELADLLKPVMLLPATKAEFKEPTKKQLNAKHKLIVENGITKLVTMRK